MFKSDQKLTALAIVLTAALAASSEASAQRRDERWDLSAEHMHLDSRFSHDHTYHDRGFAVRGIPRGAYTTRRGGDVFFYHRGEWYRRNGAFSVVVAAPIGAFVPVLPPFYSTVWWGGVPYYYADDTYYTWNRGADQYEVVSAPDGIEAGGSTQAPPSDSIFIYPKNGQSAERQAQDRYECYRSAVQAAGFDPTAAGGGVSVDEAPNKRADYTRAETACLDARGYSVK